MKKKKVIIFLYNRFFDPVNQSNYWLYFKNFFDDPDNPYQFQLISYEDKRFPLTAAQLQLVNEWKAKGLRWKELNWHPGQGMINKAKDIISGFFVVAGCRFKGYRYITTLASVAGCFGYLYAVVLRMKLFLYSYEPHSEYAIDNKMWASNSKQFKILHFLEKKSAHFATVIASGTRFMEDRLKKDWKVKGEFIKIPTVANQHKFVFSQSNRDEIRRELGIKDSQWLLFYPGKFGDLYYREETAFMYKWLRELEPTLHFLVVTPHTDEEVKALFDEAEVLPEYYTIAHSGYEDIHKYYAAADFAVIAVPPGPSKKFISNIKVGEYLCAGLPFLITRGVSEDYWYAENKKVGVVVDDFKEEYIKKAWPLMKEYFEMDKEKLRKHCREIGIDYRGFDKLNIQFRLAMFKLVNNKR